MFQFRAEAQESALGTVRAALHPHRPDVRHALSSADVHRAESAEIAILGAKRTVDDVHVLYEFRRQTLERPQIALPMPLGPLVLLNVVHQNLESAADPAMVQVETEAADLE